MMRWARWAAAAVIGAAVVAACQERLTSPAECPALCPGGSLQVFDTIVPALAGLDSSFPAAAEAASGGYVNRGNGVALLVSSGFAASDDRAVYRFAPRSDQLLVRDTLRTYTVDSALINLTLVARDTLLGGLKVYLYRLPSTVDSTVGFADVDPLLTPASLIDSIVVPDSVHKGTLSAKLTGPQLAQVALVGADSALAIGVAMTANGPSGIRVGTLTASDAAIFTSFLTLDIPDTGAVRKQTVARSTVFNTFVTANPILPVDSLLTVGSEPSHRALIRFGLPSSFLDSVTIVRATLELTPTQPILSLPTDLSGLDTRAVVGDIGAKSPVTTTDSRYILLDTLPVVQSDTVRIDLTSITQLWQGSPDRPQSVFIKMVPEAATFARAVFFSTRSHGPDPSVLVGPRVRITYQRSFPFETP